MLRRVGRQIFPPTPHDPRYRVLERRDVREAVRLEIPLVVVIMLGNLTLSGTGFARSDLLAAVAVAAFAMLILGRPSLVRRQPYQTSISVGVILVTVLAVALVDVPQYSALLLGDYAVIIVGSALLVPLNEASHRVWLAVAAVPFALGFALADLSTATRQQGLMIVVAAVAASVIGNSLVQRRRERRWAQVTLLRKQRRELRDTVAGLKAARATIATLEGVLPICAHCKRIRDKGDVWVRVETYVEKRSAAQFSHGICPDCMARYYKALDQEPD
jgi:energy-converting hydrogenase Eha subunit A